MAEAERHQNQIESDLEALSGGTSFVALWLKKIEAARAEEKEWRKQAEEAIQVYESSPKVSTPYNVLHANGQVLLPALYNSTPVPDVRRRHDSGGAVEKMVVDLTERVIATELDEYDFDSEMRAIVRDSYVTGRGVLRIRYAPHMGEDGSVAAQETRVESVDWDRFVRGPATSWARMPWVAQIHDLPKDQLATLNPIMAEKIAPGGDGQTDDGPEIKDAGILKTTRVYEIWDRGTKAVYFIAEKHKDQPLLVVRDPLGLPEFFPFFKPLQPATRVSCLTPLVPYESYRRQADELNVITSRINALVRQLKVRGIYDARLDQDMNLLRTCEDGEYIAAKDATALAQGAGGLESAIAHWPMEPTVAALQQLYLQRAEVKAIIDQISGVADILRGEVDPNEKLGQTQIKQQAGSIRITDWQNEIARLARDVFRAKVAIYSKHYSDQTLMLKSGLPSREQTRQAAEQQQVFPIALQAFRSDMRAFIIDIETDSTIRADMTRNQEQMNVFLSGTGQFVQGMVAAGQALPPLIPTMVEVYTAFARKFKLGKQAEDALDKLPIQVEQAMAQMQSQPNPEQQKADQEAQRAQAEDEREQAKAAREDEREQMKAQREDQKFAREEEREMLRHQREMERMDREDKIKAREAEFRERELATKGQLMDAEIGNRREMARIDQVAALLSKGINGKGEGGIDPSVDGILMQLSQQIAEANAAALAAINAPKEIQIARGKDGKVASGTIRLANGRAS